jgi:hypothetical protein
MSVKDLDPEEYVAFMWQRGSMGGFNSLIMQAITIADEDNLNRLEKGFPLLVGAYKKYSRIKGWWQSVEKKVAE